MKSKKEENTMNTQKGIKRTYLVLTLLAVTMLFVLAPQTQAIENLGNGTYILTASEYTSLTDQQIADYMVNTFAIHNARIAGDKIEITYNLVYVEPTHIDNTVKVFNYQYPTYIDYSLLDTCLNLTNNNYGVCVNVLINAEEPATYEINGENVTIQSTYYQALQQGINKYNSAIQLKQELEQVATMEEFISNI